MDKHLSIEPALPALNVSHIEKLAEAGRIMSLDGEVMLAASASSDDLVAWMIIEKRLREISRRVDEITSGEMLARCREVAGPISTPYGVAKESISRGSISGIASERIRRILEEAAENDAIPWEAVDNIAPLKPHVTPARAADYAETVAKSNKLLAAEIEANLPERRRVVKLDTAGM